MFKKPFDFRTMELEVKKTNKKHSHFRVLGLLPAAVY